MLLTIEKEKKKPYISKRLKTAKSATYYSSLHNIRVVVVTK